MLAKLNVIFFFIFFSSVFVFSISKNNPSLLENDVVLSLVCVLFRMTRRSALGILLVDKPKKKKVVSSVLIQQNGHRLFVFMQNSSGMNESA